MSSDTAQTHPADDNWHAVRIAAGLSAAELAKRFNVSPSTVARFERHDPVMGERFRNKLALAYKQLAAETAAVMGKATP